MLCKQTCFRISLLLDASISVGAVLTGAAVLPHGDFAFDPEMLQGVASSDSLSMAQRLHAGSVEAAAAVAALRPEAIVLTTPHGYQNSWDLSFYGNSQLRGTALLGRDLEASFGPGSWPRYEVPLAGDGAPALAAELVEVLRQHGSNATLLKAWNDVLPQELHWGEVLPLELLRRAGRQAKLPPVLVVGLPLSRYNHTSRVAEGVFEFGRVLGQRLEQLTTRIALVVSTDLAHRHWANTSFGFSPAAAPFDEAMGRWARTLDRDALMGAQTLSEVDHIYSCGYLGMVALHGALTASNASFSSRLTAIPAAPTYYGMMAAHFDRLPETASYGNELSRTEQRTDGIIV